MDVVKTTDLAGDALREPPDSNARHAALFERITARVLRYFHKHVWDKGEAEELAQRSLVELERSLREGTYDPARSFNTWIWLKAHTMLAQWCRERAKRPAALPGPDAEDVARVASQETAASERLDAVAVLKEVQRRLGDECYEQFVLYYEGGLSQAEVAEATGTHRRAVAASIRDA